jgi:hypothetical protein
MIPVSHVVTVPIAHSERYQYELSDYWNIHCPYPEQTKFDWFEHGDRLIVRGSFRAKVHDREFLDWHDEFITEMTDFPYPAPTPEALNGYDPLEFAAIPIIADLYDQIEAWVEPMGLDPEDDMVIDFERNLYRFRDANTAVLFRLKFG